MIEAFFHAFMSSKIYEKRSGAFLTLAAFGGILRLTTTNQIEVSYIN